VQLVQQDPKETLVLKDLLVLKVSKVFRVMLVLQVPKVLQEPQALQALLQLLQDQQEPLVLKVLKE
jgi:hypothetical protein